MGATLQAGGCVYRTWAPFAQNVSVGGDFLRAGNLVPVDWHEIPLARDPAGDTGLDRADIQVLVAAVLNTPNYGGGLQLAPDARIDDGLLCTVFVKNLNALQVLGAVPRLLLGGGLPESYVHRVSTSRVRLTADRACLFHGDGEIFGPAPVEVDVVPRAVRVLAPAPMKFRRLFLPRHRHRPAVVSAEY